MAPPLPAPWEMQRQGKAIRDLHKNRWRGLRHQSSKMVQHSSHLSSPSTMAKRLTLSSLRTRIELWVTIKCKVQMRSTFLSSNSVVTMDSNLRIKNSSHRNWTPILLVLSPKNLKVLALKLVRSMRIWIIQVKQVRRVLNRCHVKAQVKSAR